MKNPYLLHIFCPTKNVSPFDINMAYEARYDAVIPHSDVTLDDIRPLTQDTIFSRGPTGVKRTGIFIGGRDFGLALDMLDEARKSMVPPFEVSVFVDPSGAITTAAALMACVEWWVRKRKKGDLEGKNVQIFGGTGPVGVCAGLLASQCGAKVTLVSHQGAAVAQALADRYNARFRTDMRGGDSSSEAASGSLIAGAEIAIGAAKAGVCVLSEKLLKQARKLMVAADVNAVPPTGIEGVGVHDMGKPIAATPAGAAGIGALAVGNIKYKVHTRLFKKMFEAKKPLYLSFPEAFQVAREIVSSSLK
ncbi:MAG TPA: NAD(P)-dependent methylenetetrahydromethanopterin dehydrogenase [Gammaproteobacteria bacterium]|nr:NAD(P)-dependent methylenetetrahydromethanopterin dehydrogenase [Gammaproteobacteria bacterium]